MQYRSKEETKTLCVYGVGVGSYELPSGTERAKIGRGMTICPIIAHRQSSVLDRLDLLACDSELFWAVLNVLVLFSHVPLLSLSALCRFWPFSDVRTRSRDDSERNVTFWHDHLLSLTDEDAYYATYDPRSTTCLHDVIRCQNEPLCMFHYCRSAYYVDFDRFLTLEHVPVMIVGVMRRFGMIPYYRSLTQIRTMRRTTLVAR